MSKIVINDETTQFASCRVYLIDCTYNNQVWQDDPNTLMAYLRDQLDRIKNFEYKTIKIHNIRKAISTSMEVHIGDITYNNKDRLTSTEIDMLRVDLQTALQNIQTFSITRMDVVSDMFLEQPSSCYIFDSMSQVII
jgi:hypothetical protein